MESGGGRAFDLGLGFARPPPGQTGQTVLTVRRSSSERCAPLRWLAFAAISTCGAALACQRSAESVDAYEAKNAVVRYNQALVEAYRSSKASLLQGFATDAEVSRVAAVIAGLARQGQYMEARQTSFKEEATTTSPKLAEVRAVETWLYEHRSLDAREAAVPSRTVTYHLTYRLIRQDGRWLPDRVLEEGLGPPEAGGP